MESTGVRKSFHRGPCTQSPMYAPVLSFGKKREDPVSVDGELSIEHN